MKATPQDLAKLDRLISGKPEAPERIYGWLDTQLSLARFYGGITHMGHSYVIEPVNGTPLVRSDVLAREAKEAKAAAKLAKAANADKQGVLGL